MNKIKLLFVCTSGYRADIAAAPFEMDDKYECKSCGVYSSSAEDLEKYTSWADKIICVTKEHSKFIQKYFSIHLNKLISLDLSEYAGEEEILSSSKEKVLKSLGK